MLIEDTLIGIGAGALLTGGITYWLTSWSGPAKGPWRARESAPASNNGCSLDPHGLLSALIRPIFNAESIEQAVNRLSEAVAHLDGRMPKIATMLEGAEPDILAFYAFPSSHWRKLRSTNPLERFNKEIGRRTDVVAFSRRSLPDPARRDALHRRE